MDGWLVAGTPPGACADPAALDDDLDWIAARVPGTVAGALRDAGRETPDDLDAHDWWFRVALREAPASDGEEVLLRLDGIATVSEVWLGGDRVLFSDSMFAAHAVDVGARLTGEDELVVCCRALTPLLAERRKPRARWRTKLADGNLRFFRTMLLGRAPGFAPGPAAVGPWRDVRVERRRGAVLESLAVRPRLDGDDGVLVVDASVRGADEVAVVLGGERVVLGAGGHGELRVPGVARWWPHTHGEPVLHDVHVEADGALLARRRVGFRALEQTSSDGFALAVNGVSVFARGAVWTPVDPVGLAPSPEALRAALVQVRDAGMNLLRIPGTAAYESAAFHEECDELGILVWQDLMFANFDYPFADEAFRATVEREVRQELAVVAGRPSLAVLCGGSEIEQQAAMFGVDPALLPGEALGEWLPALAREAGADVPWVSSAPSGGVLPFRPDVGVANFFGVGGYRRPLSDARTAGVRFASECLAFANLPDAGDPDAGVPRDVGAEWDFADVRDHYLRELYAVDPAALRRDDPHRHLVLSRAVTGEVMAEVLGEWRRAASPCAGALILWLRDLAPGAGWGLVETDGTPKLALGLVRRALAPVALWTVDEGLGGVVIHVANDGPEALRATLRVALYREDGARVDEGRRELTVGAHGAEAVDVEALLGHFVDASWAYRFGPPVAHVIVASLSAGDRLVAQAVRFPAGRPTETRTADELGVEATVAGPSVTVRARGLLHGVRVLAPGFTADDDGFCVEPGGERTVTLAPRAPAARFTGATVTALNLRDAVAITPPG